MAVVLVSKPLTVLTLYNNRKQIQKGIVQGGNSMSFLVGERSMVAHGVWWNGLCPLWQVRRHVWRNDGK